jgi:hypothetical protein
MQAGVCLIIYDKIINCQLAQATCALKPTILDGQGTHDIPTNPTDVYPPYLGPRLPLVRTRIHHVHKIVVGHLSSANPHARIIHHFDFTFLPEYCPIEV